MPPENNSHTSEFPHNVTLNATALQGRILNLWAIDSEGAHISQKLASGVYSLVGDKIIHTLSAAVVAVINRNEDDAGETKYENISDESEYCVPLNQFKDDDIEVHIAELRSLIDGEDDDLAETLKPFLGILLAEQQMRARQRSWNSEG